MHLTMVNGGHEGCVREAMESKSYVQAWRWIFVGAMVNATRGIHSMGFNPYSSPQW